MTWMTIFPTPRSDQFPKRTGGQPNKRARITYVSLPPRLAKKPKRETRWRSQAHCNFVRSFACSMPGCKGMPIEVAHLRIGSGAGMSQKPDDWRSTPLCKHHHAQQHTQGEESFWKAYETVSGQTVYDLIDALCASSPRASKIREVREG